jgi:hypothetical protein
MKVNHFNKLRAALNQTNCERGLGCDRVFGAGRSSLKHLRSGSGDSGCETKRSSSKTQAASTPWHLWIYFEGICSKIKLASYFEQLFYEYGSNQCS